MSFHCDVCCTTLQTEKSYQKHLQTASHKARADPQSKTYKCECGKSYASAPSLCFHRRHCMEAQNARIATLPLEEQVVEMRDQIKAQDAKIQEMQNQINQLLEIASSKPVATTTIETQNNITNNIETQNNTTIENVSIHINAFGEEDLSYLTDRIITRCVDRIYKSVPAIVELIHFDPSKPQNNNIKITNKKLPYASVMGDNNQWKMINRKDAIETMITNGYNVLEEKYPDIKQALNEKRQQHFEAFQSRFEDQDKEIMKQLKTDVELMLINWNRT